MYGPEDCTRIERVMNYIGAWTRSRRGVRAIEHVIA
jgi:hypothetical protein